MNFSLKRKLVTEDLKIPEHLAVIMDGNGRWANKRGLPRKAGHRAGADSVRQTVKSCYKLGIKYLTLYAFSSENWNRPKAEVDALMNLLERFLIERLPDMLKDNVKLNAIGRIDMLPENVRRHLEQAIEKTANNTAVNVILALSYGGREEIVDASKCIAQAVLDGKLSIDEIDNNTLTENLYTSGIPDPDLLIRTSGELRLSNFLLWQLSYTEIFVTEKNWPEFNHKELLKALAHFTKRDRRFGKL